MNEFASLQPLLPLSERNKSEKKHGSLVCDTPVAWPFTSPVQNSTVCVCYVLDRDKNPSERIQRSIIWGLYSDSSVV